MLAAAGLFASTSYESYSPLFDAEYVGSRVCGDCHTENHALWKESPHAKMLRRPTKDSVVGNFDDHDWRVPGTATVVARMTSDGKNWFMALVHPRKPDVSIRFRIDWVVGYQYRQVYLTQEPGGVLRRLPLQWSVERGEFFPYWNLQEGSAITLDDLWTQMGTTNSAWNLFCARCHTTNLVIERKNAEHTEAVTHWSDDGIACEACHGPGSMHVNYFATNIVNRVVAFANSKLRGEPVAYIAMARKLPKGQDLSVCARCHGPDILLANTNIYRIYEPGYSKKGRINDLSPHFKETPLTPGRKQPPTMECWEDGRPKGIGMLFRSFIESKCYDKADPRCYDCHHPHAAKAPRVQGLLQASDASNEYCLRCHDDLRGREDEHSHHAQGTAGSFCYDCHMPHSIQNIVGGYEKFVRTHNMSTIPNPAATVEHGMQGAPNACNECHTDETAEWAVEQTLRLWK